MYMQRAQNLGFLSTVVKAVSGGAKVASGVTRAASTVSKAASAASNVAKAATAATSAAKAASTIARAAGGASTLTKALTGGTRNLTSAVKGTSNVTRSIASVAGSKGAGSIVEIATAAPTISPTVKNAPAQLVQAVTDVPTTSGGAIRGLSESIPAAMELYAMAQGGGLVAAGAAATGSPVAPENQYPSAPGANDYTQYLPEGGTVSVNPQLPEWLLPVGIGAALLIFLSQGER